MSSRRTLLCPALAALVACGQVSSNPPDAGYDGAPSDPDARAFDADLEPDANEGGGEVLWARTYGGVGYDRVTDLAIDSRGEILVSGFVSSAVSVGGDVLGAQGSDGYVAKYSSAGGHIWSRLVGGLYNNSCRFGDVDPDDAWVVGCPYRGSLSVADQTIESAGGTDAAVVKHRANGDLDWVISLGGADDDGSNDVVTDAGGNVIAVGLFRGTANFGPHALTASGDTDVYVAKISAGGAVLWARSFGGPGRDDPYAVDVDSNGNIAVTGEFAGGAEFAGTTLAADGQDAFVIAFGPAGEELWGRGFGGEGRDRGLRLDVGGSDQILVSGMFDTAIDFGGDRLESAAEADAFIVELTADGQHRWSTRIGGTGSDEMHASYGPGGHILVDGFFTGTLSIGDESLASEGDNDIVLARLDADRKPIWVRHIGGPGNDITLNSVWDQFLVAGGYHEGVESLPVSSNGERDLLLVRLDP